MKLGFVFDVCFTYYNEAYYSTNLTPEMWENRYLCHFDEIVVVGRCKEVNEDPSNKLVRSDLDRVKFRCMTNESRIKRIFMSGLENIFIEEAIKDCDYVICRSWWGVEACKKLNKKYMIEVVNCAWDGMWNHSLLGKFVAIPYYFKQKLAIKNAPYALYVTKEFLQRRYPCNGITAGISDVMLKKVSDDSVLESRVKTIQNVRKKIIIGTAAAVNVKYKGQRFVVKALSILKNMGYDNFEYHMVGGGDNTALLRIAKKYNVEECVKFYGSIPHDDLFTWLDSVDIYIQPSLQEGLPRAVVEAMSRALPCICLNTGGMPELIDDIFVCSKKGNIAKNISNKLLYVSDRKIMETAAINNYKKSKEYEVNKLNSMRNTYMNRFINDGD